eukprot:TRINITY_DN3113_c0_g1_i6.p1 TRINITY_DN3113_c0_g1~~TRINITY_DN3113_c0_g1_i6.p1  ORF type:complete len:370 (-),score=79.61 TRINITY_DN3113_c0_g1_i6:464-1573(-)
MKITLLIFLIIFAAFCSSKLNYSNQKYSDVSNTNIQNFHSKTNKTWQTNEFVGYVQSPGYLPINNGIVYFIDTMHTNLTIRTLDAETGSILSQYYSNYSINQGSTIVFTSSGKMVVSEVNFKYLLGPMDNWAFPVSDFLTDYATYGEMVIFINQNSLQGIKYGASASSWNFTINYPDSITITDAGIAYITAQSEIVLVNLNTPSIISRFPNKNNETFFSNKVALSNNGDFFVSSHINYNNTNHKVYISKFSSNGNLVWQSERNDFVVGYPVLSLDQKSLFFHSSSNGYNSTLFCLDSATGNTVWNYSCAQPDTIYLSADGENVFIVDDTRHFTNISISTGEVNSIHTVRVIVIMKRRRGKRGEKRRGRI